MNQFFTFTSRVLAALLFVALTTESAAQSFPLPYNPDENGDGLIGVVDLQGLLANYGSEFSGAVISEDGESAMTFMGGMAYPLCAQACRNLPGMWEMPDIEDLGLIWDEVANTNSSVNTWLKRNPSTQTQGTSLFYSSGSGINEVQNVVQMDDNYRCYCAAKQLPRVEYDYCFGTSNLSNQTSALSESLNDLKACVNEKLSVGWHLLGTTQPQSFDTEVQGLWRWAE